MKKLLIVLGMMVAGTYVFAAGGVIPDGQGTNWSYGDIYGQGSYVIRNFILTDVDGAGVTNIPVANVIGAVNTNDPALTNARAPTAHSQGWDTITNTPTTVSGYGITDAVLTNDPALTNARAPLAHTQAWSTITETPVSISGYGITNVIIYEGDVRLTDARVPLAHDQDWSTITNTPISLAGYGITNVIPDATAFLSTNATEQSKAGLLTLSGGLTVAAKTVFVPSAIQTLTNSAAIAADAAVVKVQGDSDKVGVTIANGTSEGQTLLIRGLDNAKRVQLTTVIPPFTMGVGDVIAFTWDGASWIEQYRKDN